MVVVCRHSCDLRARVSISKGRPVTLPSTWKEVFLPSTFYLRWESEVQGLSRQARTVQVLDGLGNALFSQDFNVPTTKPSTSSASSNLLSMSQTSEFKGFDDLSAVWQELPTEDLYFELLLPAGHTFVLGDVSEADVPTTFGHSRGGPASSSSVVGTAMVLESAHRFPKREPVAFHPSTVASPSNEEELQSLSSTVVSADFCATCGVRKYLQFESISSTKAAPLRVCSDCFRNWLKPGELFYDRKHLEGLQSEADKRDIGLPAGSGSSSTPVTSLMPPKVVTVGDIVEAAPYTPPAIDQNLTTNVAFDNFSATSVRPSAHVTTAALPLLGNVRVDFSISSVLTTGCAPLDTADSFMPKWDMSGSALTSMHKTNFVVEESTLYPSITLPSDSTWFGVILTTEKGGRTSTSSSKHHHQPSQSEGTEEGCVCAGITIGDRLLVERLQRPSDLKATFNKSDPHSWGCFSNGEFGGCWSFEERPGGDGGHWKIYLCVDRSKGHLYAAPSIRQLCLSPTLIGTNLPRDPNAQLRTFLYSTEAAKAQGIPGAAIYDDSRITNVPWFAVVDADHMPEEYSRDYVISARQDMCSKQWVVSPEKAAVTDGDTFWSNEAISVIIDRCLRRVEIRVDGHLYAYQEMAEWMLRSRVRLTAFMPHQAMILRLLQPAYTGPTYARVVEALTPDLLRVTPLMPADKPSFVVSRAHCRLVAFRNAQLSSGCAVAILSKGNRRPYRGTISSVGPNGYRIKPSVEGSRTGASSSGGAVRADDDLKVPFSCVYDVSNEDASFPVVPTMLLPTLSSASPANKAPCSFIPGLNKLRAADTSSYNGIMFGLFSREAISIHEIAVGTATKSTHKVNLYFLPGNYLGHETTAASWKLLASMDVTQRDVVDLPGCSDGAFSIPLATPLNINPNSAFSLYINSSNNCAISFYGDENGVKGGLNSEMDSDGVLAVLLGKKSEAAAAFSTLSGPAKGFHGRIGYTLLSCYTEPYVPAPTITGGLWGGSNTDQLEAVTSTVRGVSGGSDTFVSFIEERDRTVNIACRPQSTSPASRVELSMDTEITRRVRGLSVPVLFEGGGTDETGRLYDRISVYIYHKSTRDAWHWVFASDTIVQRTDFELQLSIPELVLHPGKNHLRIIAASQSNTTKLAQCKSEGYNVSDSGITVFGFCGTVRFEEAPHGNVSLGHPVSLIPGQQLSQTGGASYNGLMFDVKSSVDVVLNEIYFVPQTDASGVTVKVYYKEGSMNIDTTNEEAWTELLSTTLNIADRREVSPGRLHLALKANTRYGLYINTSNSCGMRFYSSGDGLQGDACADFDSDGTLQIFVGRKSEASAPFRDISDPRGFKGRLVYQVQQALEECGGLTTQAAEAFTISKLMSCVGLLAKKGAAIPGWRGLIAAASKFVARDVTHYSSDRVDDAMSKFISTLAASATEAVVLPERQLQAPQWPVISPGDCAISFKRPTETISRLTAAKLAKNPRYLLPVHRVPGTSRPFTGTLAASTTNTPQLLASNFGLLSEIASGVARSRGTHVGTEDVVEIPDLDDEWLQSVLSQFITSTMPNFQFADLLAEKLVNDEDITGFFGPRGIKKARAEDCIVSAIADDCLLFKVPAATLISATVTNVTTPFGFINGGLVAVQLTKETSQTAIRVSIVSNKSASRASNEEPPEFERYTVKLVLKQRYPQTTANNSPGLPVTVAGSSSMPSAGFAIPPSVSPLMGTTTTTAGPQHTFGGNVYHPTFATATATTSAETGGTYNVDSAMVCASTVALHTFNGDSVFPVPIPLTESVVSTVTENADYLELEVRAEKSAPSVIPATHTIQRQVRFTFNSTGIPWTRITPSTPDFIDTPIDLLFGDRPHIIKVCPLGGRKSAEATTSFPSVASPASFSSPPGGASFSETESSTGEFGLVSLCVVTAEADAADFPDKHKETSWCVRVPLPPPRPPVGWNRDGGVQWALSLHLPIALCRGHLACASFGAASGSEWVPAKLLPTRRIGRHTRALRPRTQNPRNLCVFAPTEQKATRNHPHQDDGDHGGFQEDGPQSPTPRHELGSHCNSKRAAISTTRQPNCNRLVCSTSSSRRCYHLPRPSYEEEVAWLGEVPRSQQPSVAV